MRLQRSKNLSYFSLNKNIQSDLKSAYDIATEQARDIAKKEIQQRRDYEHARIQAIKEAISADNQRKKLEKGMRNNEMNKTLGAIDQRK